MTPQIAKSLCATVDSHLFSDFNSTKENLLMFSKYPYDGCDFYFHSR